jgi:hypothetical protein
LKRKDVAEAIVELRAIPVIYVAGEPGRPHAEEAPKAFNRLETQLPTLHGRHFYGAVVGDEYRACVAEQPGDEVPGIVHWTLPGGRYRRVRIADWEAHRDQIGPIATDLASRSDYDPTRPLIEYYRSQRELQVLAPVR